MALPVPGALASGDANMSSCSSQTEASPGFRAALPDCRAYELVSPAYAAGVIPAALARKKVPISADGEHVLAEAFGGFAETEDLTQTGLEFGAVFEFSRTPAGWMAEPQVPPASVYPWHKAEETPKKSGSGSVRASDLGSSVWMVPGPLGAGEEPEQRWVRLSYAQFVLREGRGRFAVVGPVVGPHHERPTNSDEEVSVLMGVSADAGHIVFSPNATHRLLWPGDETLEYAGGRSLYEYHGTAGGEPVLIGVKNQGAAPWAPGAGPINAGARLESDCGTEYSGMSASGEHVFFIAQHREGCAAAQPPADELYARVHGTETVDISEPSAADCAGCDLGGPRAPALFEGSSEDGSKVFFSTEQRLFAGAHGESGMNLYEYDFSAALGARVTALGHDVATVAPQQGAGEEKRHAATVAGGGARVYFRSTAPLTAAANANGETAQEALKQGDTTLLYVYDTETDAISFVAGARRSANRNRSGEYEPEPFKNSIRLVTEDIWCSRARPICVGPMTPVRSRRCSSTTRRPEAWSGFRWGSARRRGSGARAPGGWKPITVTATRASARTPRGLSRVE